jgi:integrase
MATTFKTVVYADNRRKDGTYNVKIRVTHNRQSLKVSTNLYVTAGDLTRGLKIKNKDVTDQAENLITVWRGIVNRLGRVVETWNTKQVVDYIRNTERAGNTFQLDFITYGRELLKKKSEGTAKTYNTALNCLERYIHGQSLDISKVTAQFLEGFEDFIRTEPAYNYSPKRGTVQSDKSKNGGRAMSLYLSNIRHIHNEAKKEFNDEDNGIIRIPQSPFKKYRIKKPPRTKKKAVSTQVIQSIIDLPDIEKIPRSHAEFTRRNLARDCFLMSFALAGMNAADLYDCPAQAFGKGERVIIYNRKKTRTRRNDEAEMHIRVEPCIAPLIERYKDPSGKRLFCFHKHYSSANAFNCTLHYGLKTIEKETGAKHFTFYSGRYSYATISRSKLLNIDKYTVHEGLNHVDAEMRVTDGYGYIERDYGNIWDPTLNYLPSLTGRNWNNVKRPAAITTGPIIKINYASYGTMRGQIYCIF